MVENNQTQQPQKGKRLLPQSELDLALLTTNSVWGQPEVSAELQNRLNKFFKVKTQDGKEGYTIESLWGLLGYYTRDIRFGNLSVFNGEVEYTKYYLDLAGDFLQAQMVEPFLICLSRVATVLELSQSKGGFLRRRMNTFSQEVTHQELEPPKKSLFGGQKKKEGG